MNDRFYRLFGKEPVPEAPAYWIDPQGRIMPVHTHHIDKIMRDPARFGLGEEDVAGFRRERDGDFVYSRKNVGRDRANKLILGRVRVGWIRLRRHLRREGGAWSVNVPGLDRAVRSRLRGWAMEMMRSSAGRDIPYDTVYIDDSVRTLAVRLHEIASGCLDAGAGREDKNREGI